MRFMSILFNLSTYITPIYKNTAFRLQIKTKIRDKDKDQDQESPYGLLSMVVMEWTGHSDYSSMKPYIDIVDDIKATSMMKFNGLLEKND